MRLWCQIDGVADAIDAITIGFACAFLNVFRKRCAHEIHAKLAEGSLRVEERDATMATAIYMIRALRDATVACSQFKLLSQSINSLLSVFCR